MEKFEQLIEFIINDEEEKAKELFHDVVVEKSRGIYEELMAEDEAKAEADAKEVAESDKKVGIDLEFYREKIKKIGPRFLNIEETETSQDFTDIKYMTKIWTAKEALYKIYSKPGINFKSQLHIQKSSESSSVGFGSVYDKGKTFIYNLYFRYYERFCLSLATSKI